MAGLCLVSWNARGVRARAPWFRCSPFEDACIMLLQETFLSPDIPFNLVDRYLLRRDRPGGRGGGVLSAFQDNLSVSHINPPLHQSKIDCLICKIRVNNYTLTIVNIYNPRCAFERDFFESLTKIIDPPFIIAGDLNLNLLKRGRQGNNAVNQFLEWIEGKDMCIINMDIPTRHGVNCLPSVLDIVIVSPDIYPHVEFNVHSDTFDSDHCPIIIHIHGPFGAQNQRDRTLRYRTHWPRASNETNSRLKERNTLTYDEMVEDSQKAIDNNRFSQRICNSKYPQWWNSRCSWLLGQKRKYFRLAKQWMSREYWLKYKKTSGQLRRQIKNSIRRYWNSMCNSSRGSQVMYRLLKKQANRQGRTEMLNYQGTQITCPQTQADIFGTVFYPRIMHPPIPYDLSVDNNELNEPITNLEIQRAIKNSKPTTPGEDGISIKLIKSLDQESLNKIVGIFNDFLVDMYVPDQWHSAIIIPILKPKKDCTLFTSYRPIALTAVWGKVFERVLLHRITRWAFNNRIFQPNLGGFLPSRDSQTVLASLYMDIMDARKQKKYFLCVNLDIERAYDSIWIDGLIFKLALIGIGGAVLGWIARWLNNRSFKIKWNGGLSPSRRVSAGIPQGSVLSPFCFMVMMHDLIDAVPQGTHILTYADDIIIYTMDVDPDRAYRKLQNGLDEVYRWCKYWQFSLSPTKSMAINISRGRADIPNCRVAGHEVPWSTQIKILGWVMDCRMTQTQHTQHIKEKAQRRLNMLKGMIYKTRGATSQILIPIINAVIRSVFEYCGYLFVQTSKKNISMLEIIYSKALRLGTGLPKWTPIPVLRAEVHQPSVFCRIQYQTKCYVIKQWAQKENSIIYEKLKSHLENCCINREALTEMLTDVLEEYDIRHVPFFNLRDYNTEGGINIITFGLPFQNRNLPNTAISALWESYLSQEFHDSTVIATDATKDREKTAIAAVNYTAGIGKAVLVHQKNSIFTAEALAIALGIDLFCQHRGNFIVISDSLSVLSALQQISTKSPVVVRIIFKKIRQIIDKGTQICLVWTPGHKNIEPNEQADALSRNGPYGMEQIDGISLEDFIRRMKKDMYRAIENEWDDSIYRPRYGIINLHTQTHRGWIKQRQYDVLIARWRTKTIQCNEIWHKLNIRNSPLCEYCFEIETPDHILLKCSRYQANRRILFAALGLRGSPSYDVLISKATSSWHGIVALVWFTLQSLGWA